MADKFLVYSGDTKMLMSTITLRVLETTPLLRTQYSTANKYGTQYEQCMHGIGNFGFKTRILAL